MTSITSPRFRHARSCRIAPLPCAGDAVEFVRDAVVFTERIQRRAHPLHQRAQLLTRRHRPRPWIKSSVRPDSPSWAAFQYAARSAPGGRRPSRRLGRARRAPSSPRP